MKYLIIGDVHGAYKDVERILNQDDGRKVIFVGDYIDHFPNPNADAKKTLDLLCEIDAYFILGNHDEWMIGWIEDYNKIPPDIWYRQGGNHTLESYGISYMATYSMVKDKIPSKHKDFLKSLKASYIDENLVVVHGGFSHKDDMILAKNGQYNDSILWDRDFHAMSLTSLLKSYIEVFNNRLFICGHTPFGVEYTDYLVKRLLIDCGSKGGGNLMAAKIDGKEIIGIVDGYNEWSLKEKTERQIE